MYLGTSFSFEPGCGTTVLERDVTGRGVFNLTKIAQNIILYSTVPTNQSTYLLIEHRKVNQSLTE